MIPADYVRDLSKRFAGLCMRCETTEDPKVLHLWPTEDEYDNVKEQLLEFEKYGAASFEEKRH
jgi:hypothetical protein